MIEIINIILNNNDLIYFLIKYNIEKKEILKSISEENLEDIEKKEILKSISEENLEDILGKLKKKEFLKKEDYDNIKILLMLKKKNKDFLYEYFKNLDILESQSFSYYNSDYFFISLENLQSNYKILKDYIDNIENKNYKINIDELKSIGNEILTNFEKELNYFKKNSLSEDEKYRKIDKLILFFDTYKYLFSIYKINEIKIIEKNEKIIRNLLKKFMRDL